MCGWGVGQDQDHALPTGLVTAAQASWQAWQTAHGLTGTTFAADVSRETLALTTLGRLEPGARVNLEPALRAGDALGGHLVSGHIDGVARVSAVESDARSRRLTIEAPAALARYLAPKGSVAVDGVSLTVAACRDGSFTVALIPHTLAETTLGDRRPGDRVNLEADVMLKQVAALLRSSASRERGAKPRRARERGRRA